jgi:NDP-sugar pyrophosphorylase family protein
MSRLRALVMTAGLGTRLRPLTYLRAKAAVPVNGQTLAQRAVRWLVAEGVTDLVLNLHHHPGSIAASVGDGSDMGARVRYSWEQPVLGSAGGPRHALPLLVDGGDRDTFLIVNGDTLTNVDLGAMERHHVESGALVTMALIRNPRPEQYGGVLVGGDARVTGFTRAGATRENYHFIGVQFVQARTFSTLPDGVPAESVNSLYPRLMASEPGSVAAFISEATFQDIGTPADYLRTSLHLAEYEGDRLRDGRNSRIYESAEIHRTAVWDDVVIGAHARLTECIIGDRVTIPDRARYERCAIVPAGDRIPGAGERVEGDLLIYPLG